MADGTPAQLRHHYERAALAGAKRARDETRELTASIDRLVEAGLAAREGDAVTLQRPEDAAVALDDDTRALLRALYEYWLRADEGDPMPADELLWGEAGYWQHWWNMLHDGSTTGPVPLRMDVIAGASFGGRAWLAEFDPALVEHVVGLGLITGRAIVPPSTLDNHAEDLVEFALGLGFEVRVHPDLSPYVIYNGTAVALPERDAAGAEVHRLTRRSSVVEPLRTLFDLRWASAIPWEDYRNGAEGVLHLLARGWSDERIAAALGVSGRTVSRRVASAMVAAGASSRFELGMKYALRGTPGGENMTTSHPQEQSLAH